MRVRSEHWELLLSSCTINPELITNRFNGSEGRAKGNALWQTVSTKLNSLGYGEKTVDGWRKTLTDWKSKTKSKAAALKREQQKTGGGPPQAPPLSILEEKLLEIMGTKALYGDELVPELGFGKTLTDWKSKTKSKAAALKREQQKTGGGPPQAPPLSILEEKLLEIMGTKALYGDELVPELGFGKTLTDWKSKTKSKAAALKREQQKTGGGPPQAPPLSILEEKLLEIMGTKALYGDELVPELGFGKVPKHVMDSNENENPQITETNITQITTSTEHDYCEEVIAGSSNKNVKRKLEHQCKPAKKILKSRPMQSNELVKLSSETVLTLKQILNHTNSMSQSLEKLNKNTESIAQSMSIIADIATIYHK